MRGEGARGADAHRGSARGGGLRRRRARQARRRTAEGEGAGRTGVLGVPHEPWYLKMGRTSAAWLSSPTAESAWVAPPSSSAPPYAFVLLLATVGRDEARAALPNVAASESSGRTCEVDMSRIEPSTRAGTGRMAGRLLVFFETRERGGREEVRGQGRVRDGELQARAGGERAIADSQEDSSGAPSCGQPLDDGDPDPDPHLPYLPPFLPPNHGCRSSTRARSQGLWLAVADQLLPAFARPRASTRTTRSSCVPPALSSCQPDRARADQTAPSAPQVFESSETVKVVRI